MKRRFLLGLVVIAGLATTPAVAAPPGDAAAELAAEVASALGGRERLAAVAGWRIVSDVEGIGLEGRAVTWFRQPDEQRSELDLGPLSLLMVVRGGAGWHRDHNGHVVTLDEREQADARTSLYVDAFRPWLDPIEVSGLEIVGPAEIDGREVIRIRVLPPGGNEAEIAVDADSALPVELRQPDHSGLGFEVVRMGDYRDVGGIQVPFLLESYNDQLVDNRSTYRVSEVSWEPPDTPGLFQQPGEQSDVTFPAGVTSLSLPMAYQAGHLFVPAHLVAPGTGIDGLLLLDTATTLSMLDRGVVERLGLEPVGDLSGLAVGGTMKIELTRLPFLQVGGVLIEEQLVGVADLSEGIREQLGVEVLGLLGYDFFSRMVVTLDYQGICGLHHGNTWRVPDGGVTLPLRFVDQQPVVNGTLDGIHAGDWRLDTGADALTVHGPAAAAWDLRGAHGDGRPVSAAGMGGETAARWLDADRFQLGPYAIDGPPIMVPDDPAGVLRAEGTVGNLGNAILERFTVTVDFSGQRVHLQPGPRAGEQLRVHTVDFDVGWVGTRVEVLWVLPGGEGEERGLRAGQRVLRLGGRSALAWTEGELGRLWAGEAESRATMVVRDGHRRLRIPLEIPAAP